MRSLIGEKSRGYFNSRPHEEVDEDGNEKVPEYVNFNSRPHEEADCKKGVTWKPSVISTHDLTKRSTYRLCLYTLRQRYFNSRPHEEVDVDLSHWGGGAKISTHDLTKRSTLIQPPPFRPYRHFNSRPHEEVDYRTHCILTVRYTISTHDLTKRSTSRDASRELMN